MTLQSITLKNTTIGFRRSRRKIYLGGTNSKHRFRKIQNDVDSYVNILFENG